MLTPLKPAAQQVKRVENATLLTALSFGLRYLARMALHQGVDGGDGVVLTSLGHPWCC